MCNLSDQVEAHGEIKKAKAVSLKMLQDGLSYETVSKCMDIPVETLFDFRTSEIKMVSTEVNHSITPPRFLSSPHPCESAKLLLLA